MTHDSRERQAEATRRAAAGTPPDAWRTTKAVPRAKKGEHRTTWRVCIHGERYEQGWDTP